MNTSSHHPAYTIVTFRPPCKCSSSDGVLHECGLPSLAISAALLHNSSFAATLSHLPCTPWSRVSSRCCVQEDDLPLGWHAVIEVARSGACMHARRLALLLAFTCSGLWAWSSSPCTLPWRAVYIVPMIPGVHLVAHAAWCQQPVGRPLTIVPVP